MKQIYINATDVYVWLGPSHDESDLAMEFLATRASRPLRTRGMGYHRVWTPSEGEALHNLCERNYWRRIWISKSL